MEADRIDRIDRIVSRLRARDIMAHRTENGVYSYGIRVVIGDGSEALWTPGGPAGLDAQVVRDGVLIGDIPHIPGSENFTDDQIVEAIATARYPEEGLYPPAPAAPSEARRPPDHPGPDEPAAPADSDHGTGSAPAHRPWFRRRRNAPR